MSLRLQAAAGRLRALFGLDAARPLGVEGASDVGQLLLTLADLLAQLVSERLRRCQPYAERFALPVGRCRESSAGRHPGQETADENASHGPGPLDHARLPG